VESRSVLSSREGRRGSGATSRARTEAKNLQGFYSDIASRYEEVRPLDADAVSVMGQYLPAWPLHGVEVCCGTGRYLRRLASSRSPGSMTVGVDLNESMLRMASSARQESSGVAVRLVRADCCRLPFGDASLGWISILDAIHLVDIHRVVEEAARVLASGGVLLVYTRTPEQNARSLLGRLFPQFSEKERRLLTENDLRCAVEKGGFRLEALIRLNHERSASREEVLAQVTQRPYSTFVFYTAAELSSAIEEFVSNLEHSGSDIVSWTDENLLLVCRRSGPA
jgi:ubiquinone/menaquinone biosynthesis C-methylase UbiE